MNWNYNDCSQLHSICEGVSGRWDDWNQKLGGGSKDFLFSPLPGQMIQFDEHIFQMGWFNHQLEMDVFLK